jgi:hypothetical protein
MKGVVCVTGHAVFKKMLVSRGSCVTGIMCRRHRLDEGDDSR